MRFDLIGGFNKERNYKDILCSSVVIKCLFSAEQPLMWLSLLGDCFLSTPGKACRGFGDFFQSYKFSVFLSLMVFELLRIMYHK